MNSILDRIESTVVDTASKLSPFLAPLPTAYLIGRATVNHLHWPTWVGVVSAVVVESLGLATMATALELYQYNATRRKTDPQAPFLLAVVLASVYLVTATGLTVLLDTIQGLEVYAPAIFPALSMTGVTLLAVRLDHRRRLETIRAEKQERQAERKERKEHSILQMAQSVNMPNAYLHLPLQSVNTGLTGFTESVKSQNESKILDFYSANPGATPSEAAAATGMSRQSVYNHLTRLEAAGVIHRNSNGVEITGRPQT
jgi:DNA-binding transcriptional ArsR family regulator